MSFTSGQLFGAILGAAAVAIFGPAGATFAMYAAGASLGMSVGGIIDPPEGQTITQEGPRLGDLNAQTSEWGRPIPRLFGTYKMSGNIFWALPLAETKHVEESGEGKGGGGTKTESTWYSYAGSWAVGFCEGEIAGVTKIWFDSVLVYDGTNYSGGLEYGNHTLYLGSSDQPIDWYMDNGSTPAYRNLAYMVFRGIQLENYGNKIPRVSVELAKSGGSFVDRALGYDSIIVTNPLDDKESGNIAITNPIPEIGGVFNKYGSISWSHDCKLRLNSSLDSDGTMITGRQCVYIRSSKEDYNFKLGEYEIFSSACDVYLHVINGIAYRSITSQSGGVDSYSPFFYDFYDDYYRISYNTAESNTGKYIQKTIGGNCGLLIDVFDLTTLTEYIVEFGAYNDGFFFLLQNKRFVTLTKDFNILDNVLLDATIFSTYNWANAQESSILYKYAWIGNRDSSIFFVQYNIENVYNGYIEFYELNTITNTFIRISRRQIVWNGGSYPEAGGVNFGNFRAYYLIDNVCYIVSMEGRNGSSYYNTPAEWEVRVTAFNIYEGLSGDKVTVGSICQELFLRAGLTENDFDVSEGTDLVNGYVVTQPMITRSSIAPLISAYNFELVEVNSKIILKKRNSTIVANIDEILTFVEISRFQTVELSRKIDIAYANKENNYDAGIQSALRNDSNAESTKVYQFPLALTSDEAKALAERYLYSEWNERLEFKFSLSSEYLYLIPTNVIKLTYKGHEYVVRLTQVDYVTDGSVNFEASLENGSISQSNAIGSDTGSVDYTVLQQGPTNMELLDIPMLDNTYNQEGIYIAADGYLSGWKGCGIDKSTDLGINYATVGSIINSITIGNAQTVLQSGTTSTIDLINTVDVYSNNALYDISLEDLFNAKNYIILGDEVLQYQYAIDLGDNTYRLSNLLRGRRGTEWATSTHTQGERFVFLSSNMLFDTTASLNVDSYYKATTFGNFVEDSIAEIIIPEIICLKPLSPVRVYSIFDRNNDDIPIYWTRRSRDVTGYFKTLAIFEEDIDFIIKIYDIDMVEIREEAINNAVTFNYTSQLRIDDGLYGTEFDKFYYEIYQKSGIVGLGQSSGIWFQDHNHITQWYYDYFTGVDDSDPSYSFYASKSSLNVLGTSYMKILNNTLHLEMFTNVNYQLYGMQLFGIIIDNFEIKIEFSNLVYTTRTYDMILIKVGDFSEDTSVNLELGRHIGAGQQNKFYYNDGYPFKTLSRTNDFGGLRITGINGVLRHYVKDGNEVDWRLIYTETYDYIGMPLGVYAYKYGYSDSLDVRIDNMEVYY